MTIYYWKGASGSESLLTEHAEAITRILNRDYTPAQLERLKYNSASPIYSFRLNDADRLLFTTHNECLHVLECIKNHDYQKSRFLKKGVLKNYINSFESLASPFETVDTLPVYSIERSLSTSPVGLDYYNNRFVSLSLEQTNVIHSISLPLILVGAAGTGKSYVSLSLLLQKIELTGSGRFLYVTKEKHLADQMKTNWDDGFSSNIDINTCTVNFQSYYDLCTLDSPEKKAINDTHLHSWFQTSKASQPTGLTSAGEYLREFRICSGFSKEDYCQLGVRQSSVEPAARPVVYDNYLHYLRSLHDTEYDPSFYTLDNSDPYDFIVVDESQNLSMLQLQQLSALAKDDAIVYCLDPHQDLIGVIPVRVLLELQLQSKHVTTLQLEQTRRYSHQVGWALNQLLAFGHQCMGGKRDKKEVSKITALPEAQVGEFYVMEPDEASHEAWLKDRASSTYLAIVTTDSFLIEARERFHTELVFTVEQIQGQEFDTVIAYKLLANDLSEEHLKKIARQPKSEAKSVSIYRAKTQDNEHANYAPWIHALFTAYSRAMHTLVIVETNTRINQTYLEMFKNKTPIQNLKPAPAKKSSIHDWASMAQLQKSLGNVAVAHKITDKIAVKPNHGSNKNKVMMPSLSMKIIPSIHNDTCVSTIKTEDKNTKFNKKRGEELILSVRQNNTKRVQEILSYDDVNINIKNVFGCTPLILSVYSDDIEIFYSLFTSKKNIDIYSEDRDGFSAFVHASGYGRYDIVETLLQEKEGLNIPRKSLNQALLVAAQYGHIKVLRVLLEYKHLFDLNIKEENSTALMLAAHYGHLEAVYELLKQGDLIDINAEGKENHTAIVHAAAKGHAKIVLELSKQKTCRNIYAAFFIAARHGHADIVRDLLTLDKKINPNEMNSQHETVLMLLLKERPIHTKVVQTLLNDERVLIHTVNHIIQQPQFATDHLLLLAELTRSHRSKIWALLKNREALNLTPEAHQRVLQDILDATYSEKLHPLAYILFKKLPESTARLGIFSLQTDITPTALETYLISCVCHNEPITKPETMTHNACNP